MAETQPMPATPWTLSQVGDRSGSVAVVTGANTGIGLETARALAITGATVVLACRDDAKALTAQRDIRTTAPEARVEPMRLDLASLDSIPSFARQLRDRHSRVDILINNAGVMPARRTHTADGFESAFGTNFLGHFALTGQLIDLLAAAPSARVVTVSSVTHRRPRAALDLDDPHSERRFDPGTAYARSKMASMVFLYELRRRLVAAGSTVESLGGHPGGVRTDILRQRNRVMRLGFHPRLTPVTRWFAQSPAEGAAPILRAALDPAASGGDFFGPGGPGELTGPPEPARVSRRALDPGTGRRLWDVAQAATGIRFLDGS